MKPTPTQVHLREEAQTLEINWSDERVDVFALAYLRGWCPCAACQGHFTLHKQFIREVSTQLVNVLPVGSYAMQLEWGDGHSSGIYAFDYLREIGVKPPDEGPTNAECLAETASLH